MTDFPASKKTFDQIVDGTDYTEGDQMNQAYDEIEALETLLGALGRSQSYSESFKNMLKNYIRGCEVNWKADGEFYVRAGEIMIFDASGNGSLRRNTSDTTCDFGDLDTGSEAASTTYYVYAVADAAATTFTVVISTNSTTPSGCTYYRKIGEIYNDGSSNITKARSYNCDVDSRQRVMAWVNFDGTTNTAGKCTMSSSYGVTDVDDNGTGDYTINWSTPFAGAQSYVVFVCCRRSGAGDVSAPYRIDTQAADSVTINTTAIGGSSLEDMDIVCVMAVGDQ